MTSSAKTAARAPAARRFGLLLALSLALPGCQSTREFFGFGAANSGPTLGTPGFVRGFLGGVAAEDPAAALTARQMLSAGGTAVDAAVAAGFMLAVTQPSRVGLGGGGGCLVFEPKRNAIEAVMFLAGPRVSIPPGSDRPAAIPMHARGLFALYTRKPGLPIEQIMAPAEQAARFGTQVSRGLAADIAAVSGPLFADPAARAIFAQPNGQPKAAGDSFAQPDLAATLGQMRVSGVGDMHQGALARKLVAASPAAGGAMTLEELRAAIPNLSQPLAIPARGGDMIAFLPPPADGGIATAASFEGLRAGESLNQAMQRGLAAAAAWRVQGGDPRSVIAARNLPMGGLGTLPASSGLVVFDRDGVAVSCAFTLNNLFGTGRIVPGMGFLLAAAPGTGAVQQPLLAAALAYNTNVRAFRLAAAASGQQYAAIGAAGPAGLYLLQGVPLDAAVDSGAIGTARTQIAACDRYLPGRPDSCRIVTDARGNGVALGALDR